MMTRKKIFSILLGAVLLTSFSACGKTEDASSQKEEKVTTVLTTEATTEDSVAETTKENDGETPAELTAILDEITADVTTTTNSFQTELDAVFDMVDSYQSYMANQAKIIEWYDLVQTGTQELFDRITESSRDYFLRAAKLAKDGDTEAVSDAMQLYYDKVYDEALGNYYDAVYSTQFGDMYDQYYGGILSDAYTLDGVEYSELSDMMSECYNAWSDAMSAVYDAWSNMTSNIYEMWSDVDSAFWDDNFDIQAILEGSTKETTAVTTEAAETETTAKEEKNEESLSGIRPEFQKAMDDYETFMDEYVDFMTTYQNADRTDAASMLTEYTEYMQKYAKMLKSFEEWNSEEMSDEEVQYYLEVQTRVTQKLLQVSAG